jgi:tetratricopeptide (TPR) repeat protein
MRQTLLRIPLDADFSFGLFTVPGFGFGLVLAIWILFGGVWLYRNRSELKPDRLIIPGVIWLIVAFAIVMLPDWVQRGPRAMIDAQTAKIKYLKQKGQDAETIEPTLLRGRALEQVYGYEYAADDYQIVIDLAPEKDVAYLHLAWLRATCPDPEIRDGEKALELAQAAFQKAGLEASAVHWDTLAAAYAEQGQFDSALRAAQNAARAAEASKDPNIRSRLSDIRQRIDLFEDDQAFREPRFAQTFPQSLPIRGYGFMMFLGFIAAGLTATRLASRVGVAADAIWDLGVWTLFGGIVGARIFYLVQKRDVVFDDVSGFEYLLVPFRLQEGGLVLLGGVLFGSGIFLWLLLLPKTQAALDGGHRDSRVLCSLGLRPVGVLDERLLLRRPLRTALGDRISLGQRARHGACAPRLRGTGQPLEPGDSSLANLQLSQRLGAGVFNGDLFPLPQPGWSRARDGHAHLPDHAVRHRVSPRR